MWNYSDDILVTWESTTRVCFLRTELLASFLVSCVCITTFKGREKKVLCLLCYEKEKKEPRAGMSVT